MTVQRSDRPRRLTVDAYLEAAPDAFGDIEVAQGLRASSALAREEAWGRFTRSATAAR
jgi:hypothetical protein